MNKCEYCDTTFINTLIDDDGLYLFIDNNRLISGYSDGCTFEISGSIEIKHCPMCGRKLSES